jgi:PAS domain S-box-containing protein
MTDLGGGLAPEGDAQADALRLLRDRGSQILNAIDDGVYCLDTQGRTIFVNEAGARMLGYTQRELLGRPQHETVHHHYADGSPFPKEACPIYLSVTDGVQQRVGGDAFWKKNGERLWVDYTAIPLKEGRRLLGSVITFRDISAQQQAEEQTTRLTRERAARAEAEATRAALEQSERRYRALVEAAGQYTWTNSPDGRMEGEQPGWSRLTGQSQAEYEGFGWASAVHPDDAQPTIDAWTRAVAERGTFVFEHRVRTHDGDYRLFSIRAVPVLCDDGSIREWVGVHTDISEQRAAQLAAEHARAELGRVFEQAPAAIATIEAPSLVFKTANALYRKLIGGRDVVGKTIQDALPEVAAQPFFVDMLQQVIRTGEAFVGEQVPAYMDRGDGTLAQRRFDFIYQPLTDPGGKVNGVMIHATEVHAAATSE